MPVVHRSGGGQSRAEHPVRSAAAPIAEQQQLHPVARGATTEKFTPAPSRLLPGARGCPSWMAARAQFWGAPQTRRLCNRCMACSNTVVHGPLWQRSPLASRPIRPILGPIGSKPLPTGEFQLLESSLPPIRLARSTSRWLLPPMREGFFRSAQIPHSLKVFPIR